MKNHVTLKQKYETKKINETIKKAKKADLLLREAIDEKEAEQASKIIEKLSSIRNAAKNANIQSLVDAAEAAASDINQFTGGAPLTRLAKIFKSKIFTTTKPADNPILKSLSLVGALENGFKLLPKILKNNGIDLSNAGDKKLSELGPEAPEGVPASKTKPGKQLAAIKNNLKALFSTPTAFAEISRSVPYVKDMGILANEIYGSKASALLDLQKAAIAEPLLSEVPQPKEMLKPATGSETDKEAAPKSPEEKKQVLVALQSAAKEAGIKSKDTLKKFFSIMDIKAGIESPQGAIAVKALKKVAEDNNVEDNQLDGFIDGISIDKEKVKTDINDLIKAYEDAQRKKEEKATSTPGPSQQTSAPS